MDFRTRRRLDVALLALGGVSLGAVAAAAAAVGDTERIDRYWAAVDLGAEPAQVTEVIDYDFGPSSRHGIFRDVPDLELGSPVTVSSPTAPDQADVTPGSPTRIRIGDPDRTVSGRHRYEIAYALDVTEGDQVGWDAVGAQWEVGIDNVEVHLLAPAELTDVRCSTGLAGTWGGCTASQPEPGHLTVAVDHLDPGEGITLSATLGAPLAAAPTPVAAPTGTATDPGAGIVAAALTAAAAALVAAVVASRQVRRAGREVVWAGGSADAAFGPQFGERYPTRLVDHAHLADLATIEFVPPRGLTAWQGGVLHHEGVASDQQVAWLLERAMDGTIAIEGRPDDELRIVRRSDAADLAPDDRDLIRALFGGRSSVDLGAYDPQFASAWSDVADRLQRWQGSSHLWDPAGDGRRKRALVVGIVAIIVGLVPVIAGAVLANRYGPWWLPLAAGGALVAGAGWALSIRSWELRVRTPEGSGLWILVESFRRFIEQSDAQHVRNAAEQGRLLEYTAWATALGEVDHWSEAVASAHLETGAGGAHAGSQALMLTAVAPRLGSATSSAAQAPSSGGSGGGSVGGGSGGGGGGSW
ncbi:MAG: DUF2207 domain-containing protein [Acidimicrobiales bacterium]